jgi:purine-nucleoside phosphorylase
MDNFTNQFNETLDAIRTKIEATPKIAIILGSGLGNFANFVEDALVIPYEEIPGFPQTSIQGHEGKLVFGKIHGVPVVVMKGRFHYYEGHEIQTVVYPIRIFKGLGIENILLTNAAGGVNTGFNPGDLMVITDHISLFGENPLRGPNMEELGPRFPDMSAIYNARLSKIAEIIAQSQGKKGIYSYCKGPSFESPAEIRALRVMGADAVGMSTVPEAIVAKHMGMTVVGISLITNMAAGILDQPLNHAEVMETGKLAEQRFSALVIELIKRWL